MPGLIRPSNVPYSWVRNSLVLDKDYRNGDTGLKIKLIQEWLCHAGFLIDVDEQFGTVTDRIVRKFQARYGLEKDGVVGKITFSKLCEPLLTALTPIRAVAGSFGALVVAYGRQHAAQKPIEIGGDNKGPWVRLYMEGNEGVQWYWCAGFVSFLLRQSADTLQCPKPIAGSFSCDELAAQAKAKGLFVAESELVNGVAKKSDLKPGSIFLVRKSMNDWTHTGIVARAASDYFETIEGNTNEDGSRNGNCVCCRTRGYSNKDFIRVG